MPFTVPFVFSTNPALVSYRDSAGSSGTVSYPVAFDGPGTLGNPFSVAADASGEVVITLTVWRPQRRPIPGEAGEGQPGRWIDIGGLSYATGAHRHTQTENFDLPSQDFCPQTAYSESDPNLSDPGWPSGGPNGFIDGAADAPANTGRTLTFTVNVMKCLELQKRSWDVGQTLGLDVQARTGSEGTFGAAAQDFWFVRQR